MENKNVDKLLEKDLQELKQVHEELDNDTFEEKERRKKILSTVKEIVVNVGLVTSVIITLFIVEKKHYILKKVETPYHKKIVTTSLGEEETYLQKEVFQELPYIKKYETMIKEKGVIEQKVTMYYTDDIFPFSKEELFQMDNEALNTHFYLYNRETIENNASLQEEPEDYTEVGTYEEDWAHTYIKNESMVSYLPRILLLSLTNLFLLTKLKEKLYSSYMKRRQQICDFSNTSSQEIEQMIQLTEQNRTFLIEEERERVPKILTKGRTKKR